MKTGFFDVRRAAFVLCAAAGLWAGGCASQQSMDQLSDANRALTERNEELQRSLKESQTEVSLLQKQRSAADTALDQARRDNEELRAQLSGAEKSLTEFDARLGNMVLGALDPTTDRALRELANQNPDLIKYDAAQGRLRFASDLTFASGQDAVSEQAKTGLGALAKVLATSSASRYELFIVGHTDSQPISSATAQRGHPTNMHLSAHRAIAVRNTLAALGMPAAKMFVAGWGEFRPIVTNNPNGNTPANRRVEIYLTRPSGETESTEAPPTPQPAEKPADITK